MNIIIPLGGQGKRFKEDGYGMPKPLIKVLGKPMLFHLLDSLNLEEDDTVSIFYNTDLDEYQFRNVVHNSYPDVKFVPIVRHTSGAVDTICEGLKDSKLDRKQRVVLLDCDVFYGEDILSCIRNTRHGNNILYFEDTQKNPIYSYIKINNLNSVYEIKEKEKISDNANVGAYVFKNYPTLLKAAREVLDNSSNGENYTSSIYHNMLKKGLPVKAIKVENFVCVGTPSQLKQYSKLCEGNKTYRICFDIDNTLLTYPEVKGDYSTCAPIWSNINLLKHLKDQGHTIILYTARRMRTHSGNVSAVVADIGTVTIDSLKEFDIPYDELCFGKPYANFYIDDLAVNPYSADVSKETGFYNYNNSPRFFHEIKHSKNTVIKSGSCLAAEIMYYKNLPTEAKHLFPNLIHNNLEKTEMEIEKVDGITYSEKFIGKSFTPDDLYNIMNSLEELHSIKPSCSYIKSINFCENYLQKLFNRYENYDYSRFPNVKSVYNSLVTGLIDYQSSFKANGSQACMIHGDPVFTNILIDHAGNIKFIDPRGKVGDYYTIYGDFMYDMAKVYQSILGYDFILNKVHYPTSYKSEMLSTFGDYAHNASINMDNIKLITNSLLFTLIPLHDDNPFLQDKCYELIN